MTPTNFTTGTDGFRIDGEIENPPYFPSLAPAGDVNNDGYDDMLIGRGYDGLSHTIAGVTYLIFGKPSASASIADWMLMEKQN